MSNTKFIVETGNIIAEISVDEDIFEGTKAYLEAATRVFEIVFGLKEPKDGYDILALLDDYEDNVLEDDSEVKKLITLLSDDPTVMGEMIENDIDDLPVESASVITHVRKSDESEENERYYLSSIIFKNAGLPTFAAEAERQEKEIQDE